MKLSQQQQIFTYHVSCLIQYAYDVCGIRMTLGEAHRTPSQVLLNYFGYTVERSLAGGIYLKKGRRLSKTLFSLHSDRLAIDFNFFIDGKLTYDFDKIKPLGDYWENLDPLNRWGGDFNKNGIADGFVDTPHFERKRR
jgi:hypothetical protein